MKKIFILAILLTILGCVDSVEKPPTISPYISEGRLVETHHIQNYNPDYPIWQVGCLSEDKVPNLKTKIDCFGVCNNIKKFGYLPPYDSYPHYRIATMPTDKVETYRGSIPGDVRNGSWIYVDCYYKKTSGFEVINGDFSVLVEDGEVKLYDDWAIYREEYQQFIISP